MCRMDKKRVDRDTNKVYFQNTYDTYDRIIDICYRQTVHLAVNLIDIRIGAFQCGNSIGAALWNIDIGSYTVGYLIDINHHSEM